jgi:hypothetical protein
MPLSPAARAAMKPLLEADPYVHPEDFADARPRWLAGLCPCCGAPADEPGTDGTAAEAVAEGVIMCGRCTAGQHLAGGLLRIMLAALLP